MKTKKVVIIFLLGFALVLFLLFYIITITNHTETDVLAKNNIIEQHKKDAIIEQAAIEKYISGDKSDVIRNINGYDVIKASNREIIILGDNNFNGKVKPLYINHKHEKADIKYIGERTKPAIDISNTHCNTSNSPISVEFNVSQSLSYIIEGSVGISFSTFESKLGTSINRIYSVEETRKEKIPARRCGTLKGLPKYDIYQYSGWIREATLYSPKGFIYFLSLSPEE